MGKAATAVATAAGRVPLPAPALAAWAATRAVLLLWVLKVLPFPGIDVTGDVSVTYRGWYEVLRSGAFPGSDVTWQYPPGAALALLAPGLLPFPTYAMAFFVLVLAADALVLGMLLAVAGRTDGTPRSGVPRPVGSRGVWVWVAGVPLMGPTGYARYDLLVTAVAVAALLAGARRPRVLGALAAFGALLKVWPVLLLTGTRRGRTTVVCWGTAAFTGAVLLLAAGLAAPGSLAFLGFQRGRGTEVESLGGLVLHVARRAGWPGGVRLRYGSVEFVGPYVNVIDAAAQTLSLLALSWLLAWRRRTGRGAYGRPRSCTLADAAFVAVLLLTATSRVISPQYMVWLVGVAAACLVHRTSLMLPPALLVLAATLVTTLEFPVWFGHVVASDALGILLLAVRNGLLVAACALAATRLWRHTVPGRDSRISPRDPAVLSPTRPADNPATAR